MASLEPPTAPYCSLSDAHLQNHFTKDRIKRHLRRAGLINKKGDILTETEYDNHRMDIEIGRQNRTKYDEAFLEVLIQMGEEQYRLLCQELEKIKKKLEYQFQRIAERYPQRVQPVKIRVRRDGHIETDANIEELPDIQEHDKSFVLPPRIQQADGLDEIKKKLDMFIDKMNTLAKINANNTFLLNLPETIRQLREKHEEFRKRQESWNKDYEEKEAKRLTQAAIDAAILTTKNETIKRESIIEQLARNANEQVKKLERQLNDLSTKPSSLSETIRQADRNLKLKEQNDNSELRKLIQQTNDKLSQLEKRFDQFPQSTSTDNTRIKDKESNGQTTMKNHPIRNTPLARNVSRSITTGKEKSTEQRNKQSGDVEQEIQKRIENLDRTKADRQTVDEQQNKTQTNDFRKRINKIEDELSKINIDLAALHRQMTQKSKSTTVALTKKDSSSTIYTEEKLQAVMPFIEPLPTFDLLIKNEWNPIY